jgi:hypothetical protein
MSIMNNMRLLAWRLHGQKMPSLDEHFPQIATHSRTSRPFDILLSE